MNMIKKVLALLVAFLSIISLYGQTIFTERAILGNDDNYANVVFEKVKTVIEESDSMYIVKSQDSLELCLKRDMSTYRLIGEKYDIISLESGCYGFCSSEMLEDKDGVCYKLQHRFYSKSKNKWIGDYELFFLFQYNEDGFPNGKRIVFKKIVR